MFKRLDVSFSETNGSTGGLPFIHLNKENFIFGLSVVNEYMQPLFDETIYSVVGNIKGVETINGQKKAIDIPITFDRNGNPNKSIAEKIVVRMFGGVCYRIRC